LLTAAQRERVQRELLVGFRKGTLIMGFSVAVLALATLCTVLLVFASRAATLRQISSSGCEPTRLFIRVRTPSSSPGTHRAPAGSPGAGSM
jgi:Na+/H+-translocating membrane pyrophosphatase